MIQLHFMQAELCVCGLSVVLYYLLVSAAKVCS